jgi:hypothetical protein
VHIYSKGKDLIYANDTYVSLTAHQRGTRTILLPRRATVTDALTGETVASKARRISFTAEQYETRIFRLA